MRVLSLFDGIACGYEALKRAGIKVTEYHAFEIDKYAIQIAKKNHPDIIHHGSVVYADFSQFKGFDLVMGGSPCQGFSFAGKQLAFDDPRSALYFELERAIEEIKPKYFLLENVRMKKEHQDVITERLGVEPVCINSALVSAQNRVRYYWCNWDVDHPEDKGILLNDILSPKEDELGFFVRKKSKTLRVGGRSSPPCSKQEWDNIFINKAKSIVFPWRKLRPVECERLQTLPDHYTEGVSNTQRYKMLGNGWTVEVIAHIFEQMRKNKMTNKKHMAVARNILNQCVSQTPCRAGQAEYEKAATLIAEHVEDTQTKLDIAVKALEGIKKHQELVAGEVFGKHGATWTIADKALKQIKGEE